MIIALSWRVKKSLSMCVHIEAYCLEVDVVILSKYIFTKRMPLPTHGHLRQTQKDQRDSLPSQLGRQSSLYLLM